VIHPTTRGMMRICGELDELKTRGLLTRERFLELYREAQKLLGDDGERLESLLWYAERDDWIPRD
jgi:hypothetical protein